MSYGCKYHTSDEIDHRQGPIACDRNEERPETSSTDNRPYAVIQTAYDGTVGAMCDHNRISPVHGSKEGRRKGNASLRQVMVLRLFRASGIVDSHIVRTMDYEAATRPGEIHVGY